MANLPLERRKGAWGSDWGRKREEPGGGEERAVGKSRGGADVSFKTIS